MAAPEAAGEIAKMERVSDTPRPTTAVETAPNADPMHSIPRGRLPCNNFRYLPIASRVEIESRVDHRPLVVVPNYFLGDREALCMSVAIPRLQCSVDFIRVKLVIFDRSSVLCTQCISRASN